MSWMTTRVVTVTVVRRAEKVTVVMKKGLWWTRAGGGCPCMAVGLVFSWAISRGQVG